MAATERSCHCAEGQREQSWEREQLGGRRIEWPTVLLALVIHGTWLGLLLAHRSLPAWLVVVSLGVVGAWFGSLQHEVIHRHPTPWRAVNRLAVPLPLSLWVPFERYRTSHLAHHESDLTVPGLDPESFYVSPERWAATGRVMRSVIVANRTILGRMVIGPAIAIVGYSVAESGEWCRDRRARRALNLHVVEAAVTIWIIVGPIGLPLWQYLVGFCYIGMSLTMLRSFAEHRPITDDHLALAGLTRSAVVKSSGFFGWLFLNNNLHYTHHSRPEVPWYRLKSVHAQMGSDEIAAAGAGWYRSYGELIWKFLLRPFCQPQHPLLADARSAPSDD